ncbi:MAG: anaerobic carbon-monoxide dehydrogenase catalytic subunit [Chloroflexota bacterium]|nr:MAG: anaerobic carbon-monoxide dehydrogenase catalytic subunit [Chloroflexota bacterium]
MGDGREKEQLTTNSSYLDEILEKGKADGVSTAFDRRETIKPCPYGDYGTCCKHCHMGPCRLLPKDEGAKQSVCGATSSTMAARYFARQIAAGAAAHSDHGREIAKTFVRMAKGEVPNYGIKDPGKLRMLAGVYGVKTEGRADNDIALELGTKIWAEFGQQDGEVIMAQRAPKKRQQIWRQLGVWPRGFDIEVVELMHRTGMGTDQDYRNIMLQASRTALADGWFGSMLATDLQDIMFGTPTPVRGKANMGVLKADEVNIVVHGHDPLMPEMVVVAASDPELIAEAKAKGAKGINIAGLCCSANELLMRHGVALAGSFAQQEVAILTGAVDAIVVDIQCAMQSLPVVASCYQTAVITTDERQKIPGAIHIEFDKTRALETAKEIVRLGIERFPQRGQVRIPDESMDLVAGFSHEYVNYMQGGRFRASYRPLNDNIINGRILGVAGVVGCTTPTRKSEATHLALVEELIANNILVLQTGCSAGVVSKSGLLTPEAAGRYAGAGLAEVCEAVGIPPVLHVGSCVDNSRILIAATAMVAEGGLGNDISDLPAAGVCPDWMHEKALCIGEYFVASGVYTIFGSSLPVTGSEVFSKFLYEEYEQRYGGKWAAAEEANQQAGLVIDHIRKKREALGIHKAKERVLFDMAMRRELEKQEKEAAAAGV